MTPSIHLITPSIHLITPLIHLITPLIHLITPLTGNNPVLRKDKIEITPLKIHPADLFCALLAINNKVLNFLVINIAACF
ncbi:hypothetical protein Ping_0667 [Psychromonas ingrahamii 37]|uniref:Uncharacterized protein n=1 Tax=Psychromonas ingrahamii (strain DSM 17664 / CCUG 51855 / 37) TaxID=357804 RepID=A1SSQ5_PSYIN|nr:hypothetical protein [Psychromonas ingrahamii]ABM02520.1 hypothetical protein Ping_0667 [Psychromonas ingrahamii 37]